MLDVRSTVPPAAGEFEFFLSPWASARQNKRLDSELAIQLRILLRTDFEQATCWVTLRRALRLKGFSLSVEQGRARLIDSITRVDICSTGFLGFPLSQLETQFGETFEASLWSRNLVT